jgi:hypothetical protein
VAHRECRFPAPTLPVARTSPQLAAAASSLFTASSEYKQVGKWAPFMLPADRLRQKRSGSPLRAPLASTIAQGAFSNGNL